MLWTKQKIYSQLKKLVNQRQYQMRHGHIEKKMVRVNALSRLKRNLDYFKGKGSDEAWLRHVKNWKTDIICLMPGVKSKFINERAELLELIEMSTNYDRQTT